MIESGARDDALGGGGGRVYTHVMHGRSRMVMDPRIPAMPGRGTSGLPRISRHCLHQARSTVRGQASCMKGDLHPNSTINKRTACCVADLVLRDNSFEWIESFSGVATDSKGYTIQLPRGCLTICDHCPRAELTFPTPQKLSDMTTGPDDRQKRGRGGQGGHCKSPPKRLTPEKYLPRESNVYRCTANVG